MSRYCLLIPVFDHPDGLAAMVDDLASTGLHCLLINDGSGVECTERMREMAAHHGWITLVERDRNGGKGAAMKVGIGTAASLGYSHALQVDADGQHSLADIPKLLALSQAHPKAVISGKPVYRNVPPIRYYGRYLTHVWVWTNTLSLDIDDSMCGFRVYPVASTLALIERYRIGNRMDFDTEILVRLHWQGVPVIQLPTEVCYPVDGVSHFRGLQDNLLISWMHTRLFFGMLIRAPGLLYRRWRQHG